MKTFIKIFLSFAIAISPIFLINSANAATIGGWSISELIADGASTIAKGTKQVIIDGKEYIKKGTAKITPTASQVSKVLSRGVAGYALSVAVEQLLGAVDWVLDPANNQIKYKEVAGQGRYCFYVGNGGGMPARTVCGTASDVCDAIARSNGQTSYSLVQTGTTPNGPVYKCGSSWVLGPEAVQDEKTLPLDVVAEQVISNAESGDSNAQVATTAAAQDIINDAQQDETKARPIVQQLEASASTENADSAAQDAANDAIGESKPDKANPQATNIKLTFPVFCGWAPLVCQAAQTVISFPQTLTGWYMETKTKAEQWASSIADAYRDFMKNDELPAEDTKVDITELPTPELQENAISWGASCPADVSIPISMQGVSSTLVFSWSPWCQLLSIIKPAIVASAYIGAAFIVLGLRT